MVLRHRRGDADVYAALYRLCRTTWRVAQYYALNRIELYLHWYVDDYPFNLQNYWQGYELRGRRWSYGWFIVHDMCIEVVATCRKRGRDVGVRYERAHNYDGLTMYRRDDGEVAVTIENWWPNYTMVNRLRCDRPKIIAPTERLRYALRSNGAGWMAAQDEFPFVYEQQVVPSAKRARTVLTDRCVPEAHTRCTRLQQVLDCVGYDDARACR